MICVAIPDPGDSDAEYARAVRQSWRISASGALLDRREAGFAARCETRYCPSDGYCCRPQ